jgi:hypothetical protein
MSLRGKIGRRMGATGPRIAPGRASFQRRHVMKRTVLISAAIAAALAVGGWLSAAVASTPGTPRYSSPKPKTTKPAVEYWTVLKIGDEYKVVKLTDVTAETKKAEDDYKAKMKEYLDAKKADPSATPDKPNHVVPKKTGKVFKSQEEAQTYIDDLKKKADDAAAKKPAAGDK